MRRSRVPPNASASEASVSADWPRRRRDRRTRPPGARRRRRTAWRSSRSTAPAVPPPAGAGGAAAALKRPPGGCARRRGVRAGARRSACGWRTASGRRWFWAGRRRPSSPAAAPNVGGRAPEVNRRGGRRDGMAAGPLPARGRRVRVVCSGRHLKRGTAGRASSARKRRCGLVLHCPANSATACGRITDWTLAQGSAGGGEDRGHGGAAQGCGRGGCVRLLRRRPFSGFPRRPLRISATACGRIDTNEQRCPQALRAGPRSSAAAASASARSGGFPRAAREGGP